MKKTIMEGLIVVLVIALPLGFFGCGQGPGGRSLGGAAKAGSKISEEGWTAVYLTNGQVYYGRLTETRGSFYKLADVYTIQLAAQAQDKSSKEKPSPRPTLVKVGNELIGSVNEISINRDHILFIQDMEKDAQVVQAILKLKAQAAEAPAAQSAPKSAPAVPPVPPKVAPATH